LIFFTFILSVYSSNEALVVVSRKYGISLGCSRRKARWFKKHKQAAALSFFLPALALFAFILLTWHSEASILT
jgi:hypothetical protein